MACSNTNRANICDCYITIQQSSPLNMDSSPEEYMAYAPDSGAPDGGQYSIPFGKRYRDKNLERHNNIKQLRDKAQRRGLDTSNLKHKWQLVDIIERARNEQKLKLISATYKAYLDRISFLDLPGELRNTIYEFAITCEDDIRVSDKSWPGELHLCNGACIRREDDCLQSSEAYCSTQMHMRSLQNLSLVNSQIRREVRAAFYARNHFVMCSNLIPWLDQACYNMTFLESIKEDGLANLRSLGISLSVSDCKEAYNKSFNCITTCPSLRKLDTIVDERLLWREELRGSGVDSFVIKSSNYEFPLFANKFRGLTQLRSLRLTIVFGGSDVTIPVVKTGLEQAFNVMLPELQLELLFTPCWTA